MAVIRLPEAMWLQLRAHLRSGPGEHFAFLRARVVSCASGPVFLVHSAILVPDDGVEFTRGGYQVSLKAVLEAVNAAQRDGDALVEVHNHPGAREPRFSRTDREELAEFVPYVLDSLPGRAYAATVWVGDLAYGEWFGHGGAGGKVRSITSIGSRFRQVLSSHEDAAVSERFDRQLAWFGPTGQRRLRTLRVGIVGVGGTGSHVVQQLVYLGVADFVVVEPDHADGTSMNRLVTALHDDVGTSKGVLARRLIRAVAPEASVDIVPEGLPSEVSLDRLKDVDVIFGCVDDDGPRFVLNSIALAYGIPYIDLAVGIEAPDGHVSDAGGRIAIVMPGGPCLQCMRLLDLEEVRHWLRSERERDVALARGYVSGGAVTAPAVVSLNGAVASIAVNEFAALVTGVRAVNHLTDFDLLGGGRPIAAQWATPRRVAVSDRCIECRTAWKGNAADLERFARRRGADR